MDELIVNTVFVAALIIGTATDIRSFILPNRLTIPGIFLAIAYAGFISIKSVSFSPIINSAAGLAICGGILFIAVWLSKGGMGMGDVKFAAMIGARLGARLGFFALWLAIIAGGLAGIILIIMKKANRKTPVPFGPFLAFGALVSLFFGERILTLF